MAQSEQLVEQLGEQLAQRMSDLARLSGGTIELTVSYKVYPGGMLGYSCAGWCEALNERSGDMDLPVDVLDELEAEIQLALKAEVAS